ncbi:MAG: DUF6090 family protein [Bacteroidota bacterium]
MVYAIGEILLVVIGILIALQINNWSEADKDAIKEIHYLKSLRVDLEANQKELERVIAISNSTISAADSLLNIAVGGISDVNTMQTASLVFRTIDASTFINKNATIKELLATGDLKTIAHDYLRSSIANWDAEINGILSYETPNTDNALEHAKIVLKYIDVYRGYLNQPQVTDAMLLNLFNDRDYLNSLSGRIFMPNNLMERYQAQKVKTDTLLQLIEEELAKKDRG